MVHFYHPKNMNSLPLIVDFQSPVHQFSVNIFFSRGAFLNRFRPPMPILLVVCQWGVTYLQQWMEVIFNQRGGCGKPHHFHWRIGGGWRTPSATWRGGCRSQLRGRYGWFKFWLHCSCFWKWIGRFEVKSLDLKWISDFLLFFQKGFFWSWKKIKDSQLVES